MTGQCAEAGTHLQLAAKAACRYAADSHILCDEGACICTQGALDLDLCSQVVLWTSCLLISCAPTVAGEAAAGRNFLLREKVSA
jgi:hypothetical protein